MRKSITFFSFLFFLIFILMNMCSCEGVHKHSSLNYYESDKENHWKLCSCGEKYDVEVHQYESWEIIVESTITDKGLRKRKCTKCFYEDMEETPIKDHPHIAEEMWYSDEVQHWKQCICGKKLDIEKHTFNNTICTICEYEKYTMDLEFELNETGDAYIVVQNLFQEQDVIIPHKYQGKPVIGIGDFAFAIDALNIKSIVIPDSIISIGKRAFYNCSSLTNIEIPNSVTSIGEGAFGGCSNLTSIVIPESVRDLGGWAFMDCSELVDVKIGNQVKLIDTDTFVHCEKLETIVLGDNIIAIEQCAFYGCKCLKNIEIPNSVEKVGDHAFYDCTSLEKIVVPQKVKEIGSNAFGNCNSLKSISIPFVGEKEYDDEEIAYFTNLGIIFGGSSVNEYCQIPESLIEVVVTGGSKISAFAFRYCKNLKSISLPDSITYIGTEAFEGCTELEYYEGADGYYLGNTNNPYVCLLKAKSSNTEYKVNEKTRCIYDRAFTDYNTIKDIYIADNIKSIGASAFSDSGIENVYYHGMFNNWLDLDFITAGSNPMCVASHFFLLESGGYKEITSIQIPNTYTTIKNNQFYGFTYLKSVSIPNSVISIGNFAFADCISLTDIDMPDSVEKIGYSAFEGCESLIGFRLPKYLKKIETFTFSNCTNLSSITLNDELEC
ncbi:MAG: leucine-rich repeat domain-containing protein, partial [Anaeroplasmataceae bacterium]|nr:leucine-rich repeat domain-containing protein [Anaeroplasmataceae bacterium]